MTPSAAFALPEKVARIKPEKQFVNKKFWGQIIIYSNKFTNQIKWGHINSTQLVTRPANKIRLLRALPCPVPVAPGLELIHARIRIVLTIARLGMARGAMRITSECLSWAPEMSRGWSAQWSNKSGSRMREIRTSGPRSGRRIRGVSYRAVA
jgi:hypothetical protein